MVRNGPKFLFRLIRTGIDFYKTGSGSGFLSTLSGRSLGNTKMINSTNFRKPCPNITRAHNTPQSTKDKC